MKDKIFSYIVHFEIFPVLLLLSLGLGIMRSLWIGGYVPTHDGEYHIVRLWQFYEMIRQGYLYPTWAPDLSNGHGSPVLMFMYPLGNYVGSIFHAFGISYIRSFFLTITISVIFSGISMYWYARTLFSIWPSFLTAVAYMIGPYMLLDGLIRGSVGEVLALSLIPFALYSLATKKAWSFFPLFLLILSHTIVGLMGLCLVIVISYLQLRLYGKQKYALAIKDIIYPVFIAILVSCFYVIPIVWYRNLVSGLFIVHTYDHFPAFFQLLIPSWGSGFSVPGISDTMSFQIGIVHVFALCMSAVIALYKRDAFVLFLVGICIFVILLMLEVSLPVWSMFPFLSVMQYPWRMLSITLFISSVCVGYLADKKPLILVPLLLIAVLISYGSYTNAVVYNARPDSRYVDHIQWTSGTTTYGNTFLIRGVSPDYFSSDNAVMSQNKQLIKVDAYKATPGTITTSITLGKDDTLVFSPYAFAGWNTIVDGIPRSYINEHGFISLPLTKGSHTIVLIYRMTSVQLGAYITSSIGLLLGIHRMIKARYL